MKKFTLTLVLVAVLTNLCNAQNRLGISVYNVTMPDDSLLESLQTDYSVYGNYSDYFLYNVIATGGYIGDNDLNTAKSILNRIDVSKKNNYAWIKEYTMFEDTPTYRLVWYEANSEMSGIFKYEIESYQDVADLIYDAYGIPSVPTNNPLLTISFTLPYPIENSDQYGEYIVFVNDKPTAAGYSYLILADNKLSFELPKSEMEKLCGKKLDNIVNNENPKTYSF